MYAGPGTSLHVRVGSSRALAAILAHEDSRVLAALQIQNGVSMLVQLVQEDTPESVLYAAKALEICCLRSRECVRDLCKNGGVAFLLQVFIFLSEHHDCSTISSLFVINHHSAGPVNKWKVQFCCAEIQRFVSLSDV